MNIQKLDTAQMAFHKATHRVILTHADLTEATANTAQTIATAVGVIAGVILDRMLDFDDVLDAGGEWDEGGGVYTRWE